MPSKKNRPVLMFLGVEGSGKTSALNSLMGLSQPVIPTIGYEEKIVKIGKKTTAKVMDFGGKTWKIWREFEHLVDGIVFFIDGTDIKKFEKTKFLLAELGRGAEEVPVMILVTHEDVAGCRSADAITDWLDVSSNLRGKKWRVMCCSSVFNFGVLEAMKEMKHMIIDKK